MLELTFWSGCKRRNSEEKQENEMYVINVWKVWKYGKLSNYCVFRSNTRNILMQHFAILLIMRRLLLNPTSDNTF